MSSIKENKIFITGGAGFIGTSLIKRLIEENSITVYDNLMRNALAGTPWMKHKNLTFIEGDILDYALLRRSLKGHNIVIHLAAIAGIDTVIKSPTNTMKVNMMGTHNVLEAAKGLKGCRRILDFSTSEVFGTHADRPGEDAPTTLGAVGEPRWTYAVSKLAAEHLAHSYFKEFGLPVVSLRPFNVYGPGQVGEGAIQIFVKQALEGKDIYIRGKGNQVRAWCYIDDMVEAILLCLENEKAVGEVFNIGNPETACTIQELANTVVSLLRSGSSINFKPQSGADVELRIPSIEKAVRILGFCPKVGLEEGIKKTAQWYRQCLGKSGACKGVLD